MIWIVKMTTGILCHHKSCFTINKDTFTIFAGVIDADGDVLHYVKIDK